MKNKKQTKNKKKSIKNKNKEKQLPYISYYIYLIYLKLQTKLGNNLLGLFTSGVPMDLKYI